MIDKEKFVRRAAANVILPHSDSSRSMLHRNTKKGVVRHRIENLRQHGKLRPRSPIGLHPHHRIHLRTTWRLRFHIRLTLTRNHTNRNPSWSKITKSIDKLDLF